jgi:RHS repeat-associated protein
MGLSALLKLLRSKIQVAVQLGIFLVAIAIVLAAAGTPAHAVGWQPACNPLVPPPCAEEQDFYSAALTSLHHNYDPVTPNGQTSMGFDTQSHLSSFGAGGTRTTIPFNVGGLASSDCSGFAYMAMTGCTNGPAGPQGRPPCPVKAGDPINVLTGNHYEEATDFTTRGQYPLALTRSYNSDMNYVISQGPSYSAANLPYQSRFGFGWRSQFDRYVSSVSGLSSSSTQIDAIRDDGNPVHFALSSGVWYVAYWNPATSNWSASTDPRHNVDLRLTGDGTYWYIQDQNDTIDKYDMTGKLVRVDYRGGYYQTFTYDGSGNNTVISDSFGRTLTFTYLANGLVDTMTDPTTGVTHYSYANRTGVTPTPAPGVVSLWTLAGVQYPDGKTLQYLYEDNTNWINRFALTGIVDENGNRFATWTYDSTTGRTLSSQHAGGAELTTISYDDVANTRTVTNALGKQSVYHLAVFQGENQLQSIEGLASAHCPAATVAYSYDGNGYVSQTTSGEGRINTYVNNTIGQETSRTEGFGAPVARTITTTWDATWREPDQTVAPNVTTNYTYDTSGRLSQLKLTDTTVTTIPYSTNGQTRIWNYTYYSSGLSNTVDGPLAGSGDTTTYAYDGNGYVNSITDVLGHVTTISSSNGWGLPLVSVDVNNVTTNYGYDLRGRITSITVNPGAGQAVYGFSYDNAGEMTVVTLPDSSTLTYAYDNAHRITSVTNNLGESITYTLDALGGHTAEVVKSSSSTITKQQSATFDELGRIISSIGAASQTTQYAYDKDNNLVSTTDPRSKVYGHAFDALNRLYQETDPDLFQTSLASDAQDNTVGVTDARSLVTSYVRDGFGDAIRQTSPDTGTTDFWFDANGAVIKQIDARAVESDFTNDNMGRVLTKTFPTAAPENVTYTYDATGGGNKGVGHLTSVADQSGSSAFVYDSLGHISKETRIIGVKSYGTTYTYDAAGHILTEIYPSNRIVIYARDALGRISGITTKANAGAPVKTVVSGVGYKPFGPLAGLTYGNGLVLTMTYDQDYQLTGMVAAAGTTTVQNLTNGFDAAGNITSITDHFKPTRTQTLTYEDLNRVATASGMYGAQSYSYDGVGNRLTRVAGGATDTYAYAPSANQITTITTGANVRTFSYLGSGQVSGDARTPSSNYTFAANNNGRNAAASLNGATAGTYLYNGFEQRVQKTVGSLVTQLVFDRFGHLLTEANGAGVVQNEYIWLDDTPVALVALTGSTRTLYFIHFDQLGSPQKITKASKGIVWDAIFDPFGNPNSITGVTPTALRFPGQYFDAETALNQNWNRDYDPSIGRYVQADPLGLIAGHNIYTYVEGDPLKSVDPFGLWQITFSGGDAFGGSISFGHNSGQWNLSIHGGAGTGLSIQLEPYDTGCRSRGIYTSFKAERDFRIGSRGYTIGTEIGGKAGIGIGVSVSVAPGVTVGGESSGVPNRPNEPSQSSTTPKVTFGVGTSAYFGWGPTIVW